MKTHFVLIASCVMAALAARDSWALGLGELTVSSYLNDPFRAEVALLEADLLDDTDVQVGLAPDADFSRFGLERVFFLTDIRFEIQSDPSGKRIILSTDAPLREPYLDFIIETRWPDGRLLREYTVLIDLPPSPASSALNSVVKDPEPEAIGSSAGSAGDAADATDAESDLASAELRPVPGGRYLVSTNDTLWRIAADGSADGVSVEQTMLEIVAANPAAFQRGNINGLKSGYVLQIPRAEDIQIASVAALKEVALQHEEWALEVTPANRGLRLVADTASEPEPEPAPISVNDAGKPDPSDLPTEATAVAGEVSEDVLPADASPEVLEPQRDALMTTVNRLRVNVQSLQAMLAEKDVELAELRRAVAEKEAEMAAAAVVTIEGSAPSAIRPPSDSLLEWPLIAGLVALLAGVGSLIWRRRLAGRQALVEDVVDGKTDGRPEQQTGVETVSPVTDPQIRASSSGAPDDSTDSADEADPESEQASVLSEFSFAIDPAFDLASKPGPPEDAAADPSLGPLETRVDDEEQEGVEALESHASIYGAETDPIDSKLDLARAYIDMGDEEGAQPVLMEVIKEGGLAQQAEARELLLRLEAS